MIKIGFTGGIGSGKSTVSDILREHGISIVDADIIAREVIEKYPVIIEKIKNIFGERFIDLSGKLKRKEFGNYIFSNEGERTKYESIIMPFIKKEILKKVEELEQKGEKICVIDGATLIENGFCSYLDEMLLVWVNKGVQISRVKSRDKLTEGQVLSRINSQMPLEEKKNYADFVLDNSNTLDETKTQLKEIFIRISRKWGVECPKI
ncbi:dephospho-CoA kinase [Clostridium ljungdahlii]|uniref:Dephospho-CoA kinase n=1 Tax=Clostridium ljungdahlii TaxID=1538 RepID=A0A166S996_9CLOT|nr:dephospho-CoA kinase [Clostridium ljungdahlii]OAA91843.1 Dephospho-CoA kinase [Clostridium ljungdahlii]